MSKLSSLANYATLCFKYQLPGEDLDALIFVFKDENAAPPNSSSPALNYAPEPKLEREWFVDGLNYVQIQHLERGGDGGGGGLCEEVAVALPCLPDLQFLLEDGD
ncbi:hypothetical protein RIF29_40010 [Crotalaria pallida]|uniref:Uncharacterized protein n=1 Tax=Crotalaria pallida TaxID=3830 RepID=A0AAN9HN19_CROPI